MSPLLLQITFPIILQGMGTLVGAAGFVFAVYSGIRNWTKADREKKEAVEQKKELAFTQMLEVMKGIGTRVDTIEKDQKVASEKHRELAVELATQKEKVSGLEHSSDMMERFFKESMARQENTLNHFLDYAKESTKLTESVSKMVAAQEMQDKWMNRYLTAVEKKIDDMDKKFDQLIKNKIV